MTDSLFYAILLSNPLPEEILRFLAPYAEEGGGDRYLFSPRFEFDHSFVKLELLPAQGDDCKLRTVLLPIQYVRAVSISKDEEDARKLGFVRK